MRKFTINQIAGIILIVLAVLQLLHFGLGLLSTVLTLLIGIYLLVTR